MKRVVQKDSFGGGGGGAFLPQSKRALGRIEFDVHLESSSGQQVGTRSGHPTKIYCELLSVVLTCNHPLAFNPLRTLQIQMKFATAEDAVHSSLAAGHLGSTACGTFRHSGQVAAPEATGR